MSGVTVISHTEKYSKLSRLKVFQITTSECVKGLILVILGTEVIELIVRSY